MTDKFVLIAGLALAQTLAAQDAAQSPFLPPSRTDGRMAAQPEDSAAPQLRGTLSATDGDQFCIYDPVERRSLWLGQNNGDADHHIVTADIARDTVVVFWKGRRFTLTLAHSMPATAVQTSNPAGDAPQIPGQLDANFSKLTPEAQAAAVEDNKKQLEWLDHMRELRLRRQRAAVEQR